MPSSSNSTQILRECSGINSEIEAGNIYFEEYIYKKYKAMVEEELANRGLLKKLKDAVVAAFLG